MKILMVYPQNPDTFWSFKHALKLIAKKASFPPLGLLTVAAMLPGEWQKKLIDMNVTSLTDEDIRWADYVFISAMVVQRDSVKEVIARCSQLGARTVAGGPLFTTGYEDFDGVDHFVLGEAEVTLPLFLEDLDKGCAKHLYTSKERSDISQTPVPVWSLINMKKYSSMNIQYSRGCPFNCSFCSVTKMFGRKMRYRSVGRVLDELEHIGNQRKHIFFYDDNFATSRARLREMVEGMLKRDLRIEWSAQVRVELARDTEMLRLMRRAGCKILFIGFESVNPETLKAYNKGQTVEEIEEAIRVFHRHKLRLHGMFVLGADTDTVDTVRATTRFAKRLRIGTVQFLILTPLPGTNFFKEVDEAGRLVIRDWSFYDGHHVVYEPKLMTPYELQLEVMRAHSEFYSLPRILGEAIRLKFFEATIKIYAHRTERRLERLSGWFLDGLNDKFNGGLETVKAILESGQIPMPAGIET